MNTDKTTTTASATPVKMRRLDYDPHEHYGKGKFCQLCRRTRESEIHTTTASAQPENVRGVNLICMSFDGDYVTEKRGFASVQEAWNHAANMGSRWFFYPFPFVTTASGKTIKDTPELMEHLKGMRVKVVKAHFAKVSKTPEAQNADPETFSLLI